MNPNMERKEVLGFGFHKAVLSRLVANMLRSEVIPNMTSKWHQSLSEAWPSYFQSSTWELYQIPR